MEVEKTGEMKQELSIPEGFQEGMNLRVSGSNIEFNAYQPLVRRALDAVGVGCRYFEEPHQYSNVQDAAKYVRLDRQASGPVHVRDGPLVQLAHLLENDRPGYRKLVQNNADEHGNELPGYYHTVTLDPDRIREAWPAHHLPKEIKHN